MSNEIMIRMEQIVKTYYIGQPNELEFYTESILMSTGRICFYCRRIRFRKKYADEYYEYSGSPDFR